MYNNKTIFAISFAVMVFIGILSYDIIYDLGKIIQVQKYSQDWKSMENLKTQFGDVKVKKIDNNVLSDE